MPANTDIIIDEWWMAIIFLKKLHFVKDFLNISTKLMNSGALVVEKNFPTYGVNGKKILSPSSKDTLTASRDTGGDRTLIRISDINEDFFLQGNHWLHF